VLQQCPKHAAGGLVPERCLWVCSSSAMEGIWGAAEAGDLAEVQRLVGEDPGLLNAKGPYGSTPLMWASGRGRIEVVRWLLDQGAAFGTAIYCATWERRPAVVRLLLDRGADPTIATSCGEIPLIRASILGDETTVRCLLDHSSAAASINHRSRDGATALWWACTMGGVGVVRALLEHGADHTIANETDRAPISMAMQHNNHACVEALKVRCSSRPLPLCPLSG
jgi:ankyrin repeat protein